MIILSIKMLESVTLSAPVDEQKSKHLWTFACHKITRHF